VSARLAVFDCDGTLADGQAAICSAMQAAFADTGLPVPARPAIRRTVGLSLPVAVRQLAPSADESRRALVVDAYKTAFRAARLDGSLHEPLFDGIADLLRRLHGAGWRLAVATGKSHRGMTSLVAANRLDGLFGSLHTADHYPSKPSPAMLEAAMHAALAAPAATLMIGDTVYDMQMAAAAGVRAIGVGWGYHDEAELLASGADAVAATPQELEALIHERC
jgi:phosphoglycolate phosphatase